MNQQTCLKATVIILIISLGVLTPLTITAFPPTTFAQQIGTITAIPLPAEVSCAGKVDLSTGTNGAFQADAVGTQEATGRWQVTNYVPGTPTPSGIAPPPTPFLPYSVPPTYKKSNGRYYPLWVQAPWVNPQTSNSLTINGGGPGTYYIFTNSYSGRVNYVSYSPVASGLPNPSLAGDNSYFTYQIPIPSTIFGGKLYVYGASADNTVTLSLVGTSGSPPLSLTGSFTSWSPSPPSFSNYITTTLPAGATDSLRAVVDNIDDNSWTGLAVYAVFCPNQPNFVYTVKFLCNNATNATAAWSIGLEPGFYDTDINIHNPSYSTTNASIVKKFVLAIPENSSLGPPPATQILPANPSPYVLRQAILEPDAAMRLDCREILTVLSTLGTRPLQVAKGFVIIYSNTNDLDVWAEYTSLGATAGSTPALDVVKIQPSPYVP